MLRKLSNLTLLACGLVFTLASFAAADVGDPQIKTNHPWYPGELSCSTFERLFKTQAALYERVTGKKVETPEQKALASWYWRNLNFWHGEEGRQDLLGKGFTKGETATREYWSGLFATGCALCGTTHAQWTAEMNYLLGPNTGRTVGVSGHNSFEVFLTGGAYGKGKWVLLDHDVSTVVFDAKGDSLLSIAEIKKDVKRLTDQNFQPQRQHGWIVSGLHPQDAVGVYTEFNTAEYFNGYASAPPMVHLRRGEKLRRYLEPGLEDGKTFVFWGRNYNAGGIPGPSRDRTWVNQPEKMYQAKKGTPSNQGQVRYGNAVYTYKPDFKSGDYKEAVASEDDRSVTFSFSTPYIIAATPANDKPWGIYDAGGKNGLVVKAKSDCDVSVSVDCGKTWSKVERLSPTGVDLTDHVKGYKQYQLKLDASAKLLVNAGLTITTVCQINSSMFPRLTDGGSTIEFESTNQATVSAGPTLNQSKAHLVEGAFGSQRVTLEVAPPQKQQVTAIYASAMMTSSNPPRADVKYSIEYSTDGGKSWQPVIQDWSITRRGDEPKDFWSQSFCYGSVKLPKPVAGPIRVRYKNTGGKPYSRAEVQLVYETGKDDTQVTYAYTDDDGKHQESHVFSAGTPAPWKLATGKNVKTQWVEFTPVVK